MIDAGQFGDLAARQPASSAFVMVIHVPRACHVRASDCAKEVPAWGRKIQGPYSEVMPIRSEAVGCSRSKFTTLQKSSQFKKAAQICVCRVTGAVAALPEANLAHTFCRSSCCIVDWLDFILSPFHSRISYLPKCPYFQGDKRKFS